MRRAHDALRKRGRDTWVDWQGILPTEEWMVKIRAAIDASQAFVFVISPDSIASPVCIQEIEHAVTQNKRLIPIVCREVDAKQPREALRKLNWIYFRPLDDFEKRIDDLIEAMDLDLEWVREHARLLVRAREWDKEGRENSLLLRGRDLKEAEQWLISSGRDEKRQPTRLQSEYIVASRQVENRRRNIALALTFMALIVSIGLGIGAWLQRNVAKYEARLALARQLAAQSEMASKEGADRLPRSLSLAIDSAHRSPIQLFEADQALRHAMELLPRHLARLPHNGGVQRIVFSPDGRRLATLDTAGRLWNPATGEPISEDLIEEACRRVAYGLSPEDWQQYLGNTPPFTCAAVAQTASSRVQWEAGKAK